MKLPLSSLLLALVACHDPRPPEVPTVVLPPGTASVSATLATVRTSRGSVGCSLFSAAPGFPGKSPLRDGATLQPAKAGPMVCEFRNLPAGQYAIAVFHDENGNGVLDENLFGAPSEGYGASNNRLHAASAPTWDESRFVIAEGQHQELTINLRY